MARKVDLDFGAVLLDLDGTLYIGDDPLPGPVEALRVLAGRGHLAPDLTGVERGRVLLVGDNVDPDVGGAQAAGPRGALVRTGKFREDVMRAGGVLPDWTLDSVAELSQLLRLQ